MTDPTSLFIVETLPLYIISKENTKSAEFENQIIETSCPSRLRGEAFVTSILETADSTFVCSAQFAPGIGQKAAFFKTSDEGRVVELVDIDLGDLGIDARDDFLNKFPCG